MTLEVVDRKNPPPRLAILPVMSECEIIAVDSEKRHIAPPLLILAVLLDIWECTTVAVEAPTMYMPPAE